MQTRLNDFGCNPHEGLTNPSPHKKLATTYHRSTLFDNKNRVDHADKHQYLEDFVARSTGCGSVSTLSALPCPGELNRRRSERLHDGVSNGRYVALFCPLGQNLCLL
jgi:hypothetical protein